ncbi:MAG: Gfo/Idh/MocA family oxidoreductase, partial [bacterium]|nr:Gfo/Idh/MocA family oxidoreductase [bacterium]
VIGLIGVGVRGRDHHLKKLLGNKRVEIAAICDVDRNHAALAADRVLARRKRRVELFDDFGRLLERRDIDAVVISAPDHWHAIIAVAAMEAGKDVYCEKPLTLTIEEGRRIADVARQYGTVFQNGSQQRSDLRFNHAIALVRSGRIGRLKKVTTHLGPPGQFGLLGGISWPGKWQPFQTPPPELDWDLWLGPAPYRDYTPNRCHFEFRYHQDHSGGRMTDWGAHHNDIAQWAIGADDTGPVEVDGGEAVYPTSGPYDTAGVFDVRYRYANGVELVCSSGGGNGVKLYGTDGWIWVSRLEIEASAPEILKSGPDAGELRAYDDVNRYEEIPGTDNHHENWLDCIRTRQRCRASAEIGHRSATVCHLGNISMKLGRPLKWDPEKEEFPDDTTANILARKPMRAPWRV